MPSIPAWKEEEKNGITTRKDIHGHWKYTDTGTLQQTRPRGEINGKSDLSSTFR